MLCCAVQWGGKVLTAKEEGGTQVKPWCHRGQEQLASGAPHLSFPAPPGGGTLFWVCFLLLFAYIYEKAAGLKERSEDICRGGGEAESAPRPLGQRVLLEAPTGRQRAWMTRAGRQEVGKTPAGPRSLRIYLFLVVTLGR